MKRLPDWTAFAIWAGVTGGMVLIGWWGGVV